MLPPSDSEEEEEEGKVSGAEEEQKPRVVMIQVCCRWLLPQTPMRELPMRLAAQLPFSLLGSAAESEGGSNAHRL
jgi:hypothetical protein